jgi:hypothetical protein
MEEEDRSSYTLQLEAGLEKTRVKKKKTSPVVFFGFFVFLVFLYICPEERVFRVFSV